VGEGLLRSEAGREGRATTAPFSGGKTTESQKGQHQQQQHCPHSKAFIEVMSNDIAEIEEAKIPGNYSARKIQRWNPSSIYATNIEHKEPPPSNDDAIHENIPADHVAPAQMYSTDSGKLFHAGSICLIMVGLPGRGKTNLSISLCRYLRWLGVRTKLFHLGDYRRKNTDFKGDSGLNFEKLLSTSYFTSSPDNIDIKLLKLKIKNELISDIITYFHTSNGQIAIYDAINGVPSEREELFNYFKAKNIRCLFIESIVDDMDLLSGNIRDSVNSPDYSGWDPETALDNFKKRIMISEKYYENLDSHSKLPFIQSFNFGEKMLINELKHDFLTTKIVYYLLNARIKSHSIYFARCSLNKLKFKDDPPITESGKEYISKIYKTLAADFPDGKIPKELVVWTSTRLRTIQSSELFKHARCVVRHRPELTQLNPGAAEGLTDDELNKKYHADYLKHKADPYHHRYPRAESYHDLALKIEPLILEMEKLSEDILVIADETVIRIFYGYLMAANANDIPQIEFPQNEIIKITYHTYNNEIKRLVVEGIESE
jgi:6-phosphofructo-2-kinase / fructose-2,6-biphosphatase 4